MRSSGLRPWPCRIRPPTCDPALSLSSGPRSLSIRATTPNSGGQMQPMTVFVLAVIHNAAPAAKGAPLSAPRPGPGVRTRPAAPEASRTVKRLTQWILRVNPKASAYAGLLAARIAAEARRRRIPVRVLAAIGWIESDYRRGLKGAAGEIGVWQLGARYGDHGLKDAWAKLRRLRPGWAAVKAAPRKPWAALPLAARRRLMDDIKAGTFLAAWEIRSAAVTCYRMRNLGHRSGGVNWRPSYWYRHKGGFAGVAVYAHYNAGVRPPWGRYLQKLRARAPRIARCLRGTAPCRRRRKAPE